jgi:hypothetical protein
MAAMRGDRDSRAGSWALPFVALAAALAFGSFARAASPFSPEILRDRLWDDGRAEYDVYDALEAREGMARPARVVQIRGRREVLDEKG